MTKISSQMSSEQIIYSADNIKSFANSIIYSAEHTICYANTLVYSSDIVIISAQWYKTLLQQDLAPPYRIKPEAIITNNKSK